MGKNIILTGFMGCGKTTVGKIVAEKLGYTFIDTDHMIEERTKMVIADIFKIFGEKRFRKLETLCSKKLAKKSDLVIATGGKLMLCKENAKKLGKSGQVFCLIASSDEIVRRITKDTGNKRPLLKTKDIKKQVNKLIVERSKGYSQFDQIDTTNSTPEETALELISRFTKG